MTVVLLASACGGAGPTSDASTAADATPTGSTDAQDQPSPTAIPTPPPGASEEMTGPEPPAPSISDVFSDAPEPGGWLVPAGQWSTTAFEVPVGFTTTSDMLLIRESKGALWMRPAGTKRTSMLVLATTAFVNSGGQAAPQLPPPRTPDDVTAAFEDGAFSVLLDQGLETIDERDLHWWDFMLEDSAGDGPWLCREGVTCLMTGQSIGGERLIVPTATPLRLYVPFVDGLRVGAWLIADNDADREALATLAEDVLSQLRPQDGPVPPAPVRSLTVDGVETTSLPAGHTVSLIGDAVVELELQGALADIGLDVADETALIFTTPSGYVALFDASGVYPADIDVQASEQEDWRAWDLVDLPDVEAFEAWADATLEITDRGVDDTLTGLEAPWVEFTVKDQLNTFPCSISAGRQCSMLNTFARGGWAYAEGDGNRLYFLDEAGLIVNVEALTGTPADVLAEAAALLGAMTVTPIG